MYLERDNLYTQIHIYLHTPMCTMCAWQLNFSPSKIHPIECLFFFFFLSNYTDCFGGTAPSLGNVFSNLGEHFPVIEEERRKERERREGRKKGEREGGGRKERKKKRENEGVGMQVLISASLTAVLPRFPTCKMK